MTETNHVTIDKITIIRRNALGEPVEMTTITGDGEETTEIL
jgi:hypothetical protein